MEDVLVVIKEISFDIEVESMYEVNYLKGSMITGALSTMFLGLFTVLAAVAAYVLLSKEIKRTATGIMLTAIILMWISTVADCIGTLMWAVEAYTVTSTFTSSLFDRTRVILDCLPDATGAIDFKKCQQELRVPYWGQSLHSWWATTAYHHHNCISTAALTVNVIIGDSIAWWRAWVLWPDSRAVRSLGILMVLLSTSMGIVDTRDACARPGLSLLSPSGLLPGAPIPASDLDAFAIRGILFGGDVWGYAAGLSSLLTNIVATTLIAYRSWTHRRIIMSYLQGSSPRTQVERTLALLVESGVLYCSLWVFIVTYELCSLSVVLSNSVFANGFYYVMEGCVVALIGMYPTLVIIVCAVDKSLHEKLSEHNGRRDTSIVFADRPPSRPRGTLAELLSTTSAYTIEEALRPSSENAEAETDASVP